MDKEKFIIAFTTLLINLKINEWKPSYSSFDLFFVEEIHIQLVVDFALKHKYVDFVNEKCVLTTKGEEYASIWSQNLGISTNAKGDKT